MKRLNIFTASVVLIITIGCEHNTSVNNNSHTQGQLSATNTTRDPGPDLCIPGTSGFIIVDSVSAEDSFIMSIWNDGVQRYFVAPYGEGTEQYPLKIGKQNWQDGMTYYKSFLSFDTSDVPNCARITYVNLNIRPFDLDDIDYLTNNLSIDIAGPTGFSGSYALASTDYTAAYTARVGVTWNLAAGGLLLHLNHDGSVGGLAPYIV